MADKARKNRKLEKANAKIKKAAVKRSVETTKDKQRYNWGQG